MPEIEHGMVFYGGRTKKRNTLLSTQSVAVIVKTKLSNIYSCSVTLWNLAE